MQRADGIVEQAKRIAAMVDNWAEFQNKVFGPHDGLIEKLFPGDEERSMFYDPEQYKILSQMRKDLIGGFGVVKGATPKGGKILVRLPESLHTMLKVEAKTEGVSLNQLALSKLSIPLRNRISIDLAALKKAYELTYDGYATDRVVVDPDINAKFVSECRKLGIMGSDYEINHALQDARKSGKIEFPPATKKTQFNDYGEYQFASEMAVRILERSKNVTLDQILCDPALAFEFDEIARQLAPKQTSLKLRWAALNLRKTRRLRPAGKGAIDDHSVNLITAGSLNSVNPLEFPEEPGVYSLFDQSRPLFAGETKDLQHRIGLHRDGKMPTWLGIEDDFACIVKYAPMPNCNQKARARWVEDFISREHPMLNYQATA